MCPQFIIRIYRLDSDWSLSSLVHTIQSFSLVKYSSRLQFSRYLGTGSRRGAMATTAVSLSFTLRQPDKKNKKTQKSFDPGRRRQKAVCRESGTTERRVVG